MTNNLKMNDWNVLVVDDQKWARQTISTTLAEHVGIRSVQTAANEGECKKYLGSTRIDLAILDVELPSKSGADGIELAEFIKKRYPESRVISMSINTRSSLLRRLIKDIGVDGFIDKNDAGLGTWILATEVVMTGEVFATEKIMKRVNRVLELEQLSARERQVLELVVQGRTNQEMSNVLNIATKTVDNHRQKIYKKLKCNNIAEATDLYSRYRYLYQQDEDDMPNFRRFR